MERLRGIDAEFLYAETPTAHMHTLKLAVLDPDPDGEPVTTARLRGELERRLHLLPPFRRRVVEVPGRLFHPMWVEDPTFDLGRHILGRVLPSPGTQRQLDDVVGEIASTPLDRGRPLWELWVIEGLEGGRIAVLAKIHHAAADGVAATQLLANVMDTLGSDAEPTPDPWRPEDLPRRRVLVRHALDDVIEITRALPGLLWRTLRGLFALVRYRRTATDRPPVPIVQTPSTSFNGALDAVRVFATVEVALDPVKEVKDACAVTLNDVLLAMVAGSLRQYLSARGELPSRPLVAGVPVSTDAPDAVARLGGNKVSNLFTSLATDVANPLDRLQAIHRVTATAKQTQNLLGADLMESWVEYAPPRAYGAFMEWYSRRRLADRHRPPINVIVSNVPGPREPLHLREARLAAIYSVGPILEGIGVNVTAWSYCDRLYISALSCPSLVADPHEITDGMVAALEELRAAVRISARSTPTSS